MEKLGSVSFHQTVSDICMTHYERSLPRKGKPENGREWTLLAAVLQSKLYGSERELKVVSMATGSKCVGASKMSKTGDVLNDSHAEVLARRGFLRYLYHQLRCAMTGSHENSIFYQPGEDGKCKLKEGVRFHFFTSQTPCGDASIFTKDDQGSTDTKPTSQHDIDQNPQNIINKHSMSSLNKRKAEEEVNGSNLPMTQKMKLDLSETILRGGCVVITTSMQKDVHPTLLMIIKLH
eukprot:XP_011667739.1 PREDICTED: tRNA-specific adenosine deaminase 1-like [Strongylocentrotus purpuratus]